MSRAFSDQAAGSSKIQVIVKEFPDYEESFDNYSFDYAQGRDNHEIESETVAVNEMDHKDVADISDSDISKYMLSGPTRINKLCLC